MLNNKFYVPILKWKRGQQDAIDKLTKDVKNKIVPLIEIAPLEDTKKSLENHIKNSSEKMCTILKQIPFFVDLCWIESYKVLPNGLHPLTQIINHCAKSKLKLIPVTGCNRTKEYNDAIKMAFSRNNKMEICLRLDVNDFNDIRNNIKNIVNELSIPFCRIHLILDMRYYKKNDNMDPITISNSIKKIPSISEWLSITLCGTSFPESLLNINPDSNKKLERIHWMNWVYLYNKHNNLSKFLQYGDYCIEYPELFNGDPRNMKPSGNIRYTIDECFWIFKGHNTRTKSKYKDGWKQMYKISEELINHLCYCGANFSFGDKYIYNCATTKGDTGGSEQWNKAGNNHHITYVINQLRSISYF